MIRTLLFFPSVTFSLISAEIFPWALIYVALKEKTIWRRALPFIILLLFSVLFTLFTYYFQYISESFRSLLAYLNPLLVFILLMRAGASEVYKFKIVLRWVLISLIALGLIQFSSLIGGLDAIFKFLIPRGGAEEFGNGRGVSLFSSEPSRAAIEFIFIYAAWRTFDVFPNGRRMIFDFIAVFFVFFIIRSATGAFMIITLMWLYYGWRFVLIGMVVSVPVASIFVGTRAVQVIASVVAAASWQDAYNFILNASGFRLVSIISAYYNAAQSIIGNGIGTWQTSSVNAMALAGFDPEKINYFIYFAGSDFTGIRPTSYLSNIALDFGIIGISVISYTLFPFFKRSWNMVGDIRSLFLLFVFSFLFIGSVGNPVPWICLAIAVRNRELCLTCMNPERRRMLKET